MSYAPFIDGSYGVALLFLIGAAALTHRRYRLASNRLNAIDPRAANAGR